MIYFITNKQHNIIHNPDNEEIQILDSTYNIGEFIVNKYADKDKKDLVICYDLETNGLDAYKDDILLVVLGDKETKFVIDVTSVDPSNIIKYLADEFLFLGHNIKFDWKFTKAKYGIEIERCYDTMIAEQRLYQNYFEFTDPVTKKPLRPFALDTVIRRYFGIVPKEMDKELREEFIGKNPNTFIFETKHILYAAKDIECLEDVKNKQDEYIKKWNLQFLINNIEMPLINVLAECELEGFVLNREKWDKIIEDNEKAKFEKELELDNIIRELRNQLPVENRIQLIGGKFDRKRVNHPKQINIGLFGEPISNKALTGVDKSAKPNSGNINYGSSSQIVDIFARLRQPLPTKEDKYVIPTLNLKTGKIDEDGFTTGEGAIENYLIDNPNSIMKPFIKTLIDFREVTTELNTFGQSFIDYLNPVTGKIHTIFRQCQAVNGRLQSGNTKESYINIQNIPAKKKFREAFGVEEGYSVITIDLSGAEVTVMADKADDTKLFELAMKGDIHSHMAQSGWRKIYWHRYSEAVGTWDDETEIKKLENLARYFIVSKTVNNETHRKPCKNLTFGGIYGCHAKKAGRTLNISRAEGQVYLNNLRSEVPLTFKMVERNVENALRNGYLIINHRTNARVWFPKVIKAIRNKVGLDFMDRTEVDGQARNIPISGTQADLLKEAMVDIRKTIKEQKIDAVLLAQVHDELVYKFKDGSSVIHHSANLENSDSISFPDYVKYQLIETANRYLTNIKMSADMHVGKTWTK